MRALQSELIDPGITADGGRIVKTTGYGILVEFPSAVDAVQNALGIQSAMAERNGQLTEDQRLVFRIGINLGDVIIEGDDIHGDGVNVAARLEGLCEPGEVYLSGSVHEQVQGKLGAEFDDLGERVVKNIARPIRVFRARTQLDDGTRSRATGEPPALPDKPSIAVMPFVNLSDDPKQNYFADGMTEDLITDLSKLSGLTVTARNSSFSIRDRQVDVKEAARILGVGHILEGSIRKMGGRMRINAQLIDGTTGSHIWADRFDGDVEDIFDLQDDIMKEIVAALEVRLTGQERLESKARSATDFEAYDLFLRGRARFYAFTPEGMQEAGQLFQQSIDRDPGFVPPYTYLSFIVLAGNVFAIAGAEDSLEKALEIAEKAAEIDPTSGMAYTRIGWTQAWMGDHDKAIANMKKGVALDPSSAESLAYLAEVYNYAGDPERALELNKKAVENDPLLPANFQFHFGHSYYLLGRYEEAAEACAAAAKFMPEFPPAFMILAATYAELGRPDDARRMIDHLAQLVPSYSVQEVARLYPHQPPEVKERLLEGLRQAGMPE